MTVDEVEIEELSAAPDDGSAMNVKKLYTGSSTTWYDE